MTETAFYPTVLYMNVDLHWLTDSKLLGYHSNKNVFAVENGEKDRQEQMERQEVTERQKVTI